MSRFLILTLLPLLTSCTSIQQSGAPETRTYAFKADVCGRVISRTEPRGVVTNYAYDTFGRLT